ncbi:YLP motif-containing protein 1-like [Schistocerca americana]|uniref:YLP motif-containing protein 1-like n=1 Tax=Schistocerca americana TaxID=7009 RepID=UPI001F4FD107|nr:YLP motif-containing protein 1-like [Schistocerca americana]
MNESADVEQRAADIHTPSVQPLTTIPAPPWVGPGLSSSGAHAPVVCAYPSASDLHLQLRQSYVHQIVEELEAEVQQQQQQQKYPHLVRGGFQPRLPTSLPPPGQQQQPSPLPRRQPVPLMPPAQLHPGAPQVVAPAPAVPLPSPPPSELMDVDPSAGPPSPAVAVQPVLQPLSLGTPKESDTAAPCPAPTQQPSTQRQETLPLFFGPTTSNGARRPGGGTLQDER